MGTKRGTLQIASCWKNGRKMWRVNVPVSLAGRRMRRFFDVQGEAISWADEFQDSLKMHGVQVLAIEGKTIREVLARFWALKEMEGAHAQTARSVLGQFALEYGSVPIRLVSPLQLQSFWSRDDWGRSHRAKVFRYLRMFFNWAERYDFLDRNPARRVEPPKVGELPKRILTPERMGELLESGDPILRAFLCLGGFVGLRSSEILRLCPGDIGEIEIHVKGGKTGERFVKALPVFKRYWQGLPSFPSTTEFYAHVRAITGRFWPANCLRHSFGTYHLARWEDAAKTAFQMGNSQAVVIRSYARAVRASEAEKWWML